MAKQLTTDEEVKLQRQARRRLIGAVALTTALVVILPMVFDREPVANLSSDIELRIPEPDKVAELPQALVASNPVAASSAVPDASSAVAASQVASAVVVASSVAPVSAPLATPAVVEKAPLSPFALQVGAYSSVEKAQTVVDKLSKQGLQAYVDSSSDKVRVRIGDLSSREAAEKIKHTLEKSGYHPTVLKLSN